MKSVATSVACKWTDDGRHRLPYRYLPALQRKIPVTEMIQEIMLGTNDMLDNAENFSGVKTVVVSFFISFSQ